MTSNAGAGTFGSLKDSVSDPSNIWLMKIHVISKAIRVEWQDGTCSIESVPPTVGDADIAAHLEQRRGKRVKGWAKEGTP